MPEAATAPMLRSRAALRHELANLEREVRGLAKEDPICRLSMTMPGIGAVVALTFKSAVDDPTRFRFSKRGGPWVGLTPSRHQSGERDVIGGITKAGGVNLRRALCQAATVMMHRGRASWLRTWAVQVAKRRGAKRAMVASRGALALFFTGCGRMAVPSASVICLSSAASPRNRKLKRRALKAASLQPFEVPTGTRSRRCRGQNCRRTLRSNTPVRWAIRVTALDQHHVGSHRADHRRKHDPGDDLNRKGCETSAAP